MNFFTFIYIITSDVVYMFILSILTDWQTLLVSTYIYSFSLMDSARLAVSCFKHLVSSQARPPGCLPPVCTSDEIRSYLDGFIQHTFLKFHKIFLSLFYFQSIREREFPALICLKNVAKYRLLFLCLILPHFPWWLWSAMRHSKRYSKILLDVEIKSRTDIGWIGYM